MGGGGRGRGEGGGGRGEGRGRVEGGWGVVTDALYCMENDDEVFCDDTQFVFHAAT